MTTYQQIEDITGQLMALVASIGDAALTNRTFNLVDEITVAAKADVHKTVEGLKTKRDELGVQCRAIKDELTGILRDQYIWQQGEVDLINATGRLSMQHRLVVLEKPKMTDFPTETEINNWQRKVETALSKLKDKGRELAELQSNYALWQADVASKQQTLAKLTADYKQLHEQINRLLGIQEDADNAGNSVSFTMK